MAFGPFDNPTQASGFLAFGVAALSALLAARTPTVAARRSWAWIGGVQLALAAEILVEVRYVLHDRFSTVLAAFGSYGSRRSLQVVLIAILLALAALAWKRWRPERGGTWPARTARVASALALLNFVIETISLHQIDAVLYRSLGPVLLNGWLWLAEGGVVAVCAWVERSGRSRR